MDGKRIICIFVVWGGFLTGSSAADNANWKVSQVNSHTGSFGSWIDIEKTPGTNQFGIVNYALQSGIFNLYYSQGNASSWTTTLVDTLTSSSSDKSLGFAYNPVTQQPAISYQKGSSLYLASFNGTGWDRQTVANDVQYGSSLAFDQAGNAIIAYSSTDYSLKCTYQQAGSWQSSILYSDIVPVKDPSIKLNPVTGAVSIAFSRIFYDVYYAQSVNLVDWSVTPVYSAQSTIPQQTRLEFDPMTNNPAVAFKENLFGPLDVCRSEASFWQTPQMAVERADSFSYGFTFTPEGRAAIAYVSQLTDNSNGVQIVVENKNGGFSVYDQYLFGSMLEFTGPADLIWEESGAYVAYKSWNKGIYFAQVVPEPATVLLLTLGSLAIQRRSK